MADNTLNITPPTKFEIKTPPSGMTDYDPNAIHLDQQQELNIYKLNLMRENIIYMSKHPEIQALFAWEIEYFWDTMLAKGIEGLGQRFSLPEKELRKIVKRIREEDLIHIKDELSESEGEEWDY